MPNNKVFVVHGRNHAARDAIYAFLRAVELEPITWQEAVGLTRTATPNTLDVVRAGVNEAQCTVVLMTGDDTARLRPEYGQQEPFQPQPRQNVIFEAGWALATGGQERTVLVRFGGLREFTDVVGLNMLELDNSQIQREAFLQRLRCAGCAPIMVSARHLDTAVAGDFSLPMEPDEPNSDVLVRGGYTDFLADSTLSHSISSLDLENDVVNYLIAGGTPNLKYSYLGAIGAQNWLNLTGDPSYGHSDLESAIKGLADELAQEVRPNNPRLDFISLGAGDGKLDLVLLRAFQKAWVVGNYYPLDLSFELLQKAVNNVVRAPSWLPKSFRVKAIHGDFTNLIRYRPVYTHDSALNFFSLIGLTFGNYNESDLLGKLRESMNQGDYLLLDARLRQDGGSGVRTPTKEQAQQITLAYRHELNNRFAFGPLEATTLADFKTMQFQYDVNSRYTAVPGALSIVTYVENLQTKFRRTGRKLNQHRLDLAVTTIYDENALRDWLMDRGFKVDWHRREKGIAFFLLRRTPD